MKKFALLIALALPLLLATTAGAMDTEELIAKSHEATGGLDKIQAIKSVKATGKFVTMGMEFPFTMTQARPGKMRVEADINGMTMIQVWDGEAGWSINPMMGSTEPQDMSPMEAKSFEQQADMDGPLVDWQEKGYEVEYLGEAEVEGTPVYQLELDTKNDMVMVMSYDAEYFLLIKTAATLTMDEQTIESETYTSDYKEVGDLIVAHSMETRMGGQTVNNIVIETIEYDVPVDDSLFEKPAAGK